MLLGKIRLMKDIINKIFSLSIINRMRLLIAVPMATIIAGSVFYGFHLYGQMQALNVLKLQIEKIKHVAALMHELQLERGHSSGFLAGKGDYNQTLLMEQRAKTDGTLEQLYTFVHEQGIRPGPCNPDLKALGEYRGKIDISSITSINAFEFYTRLIGQMRSDYLAIVLTVSDVSLRNDFQAYTNLMAIKETIAQMRAELNAAFWQGSLPSDLYVHFILSKGEYDTASARFETLASPSLKHYYNTHFTGPDVDTMYRVIDLAIANHMEVIKVDPKTWFDLTNMSISKLRDVEEFNFTMIESKLESRIAEARNDLIRVGVLLSTIIILMFWFGYRISESIRKNIKLLDEYKNAVDRSSIVSKTDRKGRITYVNDQFCAISGFTREELIGKPHSIVRHEEMPKEIFQTMWKTILGGGAWHGVVKNKTKAGLPYWVDATINPILDHKGNIEEFIAIRSDITETIRLHEELEQTQQEMINRIGEIGETRSRETGYHVRRVAEYSRLLAKKYGLPPSDVNMLANASPMHDIGKVGIPDHILNKAGPLTSDEWEIMRTHSKIGYDLFRDSERPMLKAAAIIAHEHHEKYDGSGYPRGLRGEEIHIFGRITALADVFDALGSDRCYKKAWDIDRILNLLKDERGKHFDPVLIDIFFEYLDEFLGIREAYSDKDFYDHEAMA